MRRKVGGFTAILLAGGGIGCDSATAPTDANVRVLTSDQHVVEVVSDEGANSQAEVTIPFSVENDGRDPVYLAINCLGHVWAWVYLWDGTEYADPNGLSNLFIADCGVNSIRIEPGKSFESSVFLSGPVPAADASNPFDGEYRLVLDALFTEPVAGKPAAVRNGYAVPETQRVSNRFRLAFRPQSLGSLE